MFLYEIPNEFLKDFLRMFFFKVGRIREGNHEKTSEGSLKSDFLKKKGCRNARFPQEFLNKFLKETLDKFIKGTREKLVQYP